MEYIKYVIIGSGPTGLGAAYRLKELGEADFVVLEKTDRIGGLSTSFVDDRGFTWDIGGHVLFSHYKYFDELMDHALGKDGWLHHHRESWIWIEGRFVPYPFQNNIRYLPKESMWYCLRGLIKTIQNTNHTKRNNFMEWIEARFGEGIAKKFMAPYNYKVWAYPPQEMAYQWIGERVNLTDIEKVLESILFEKDDHSWGPNNTFRFPKEGGTGAIWHSVANLIGLKYVRLNTTVIRIKPREKRVELSNGDVIEYQYLLSTMPLDILTRIVAGVPEELRETAGGLMHSTSHIVGIGLRGKPKDELSTKCWMYFPESDCPFYRVTVFSNYSPNNVPDINQYWSLMTETSESPRKPVDRSTLIEETINGLLNTKLIESRSDIVSIWTHTANHGYPVPSLKRDAIINVLIPTLDNLEVYSRGRFGGWKYEVGNQDHSLLQGVEWVNSIVLGIPEITYPFPTIANSNYAK